VADDLETPLKSRQEKPSRGRLPVLLLGGLTLAMAAAIGIGVAWVVIYDDPLGGEPRHAVKIEQILPPSSQTKTAPEVNPQAAPKGDPRTITIIDGNTGQKREVLINEPKTSTPPKSETPPRSDNTPKTNPPKSELTSNVPLSDKRLVETTKHGSIPKIGPDGSRALDVYASPLPFIAAGADSMIAIVITGLGVSTSGTGDAIAKLPAAITFGFVPYGSELPRWIARARGTGHEVLLQIPMEPFDYPDNDPGPQTLTANATRDQNIDRLHFFLSRAQGYVGVANLMGARLTANEDAMAAILAETGKRGLLFIDDGSSSRSVAQRASQKTKAPFLRSDLVIDAKAEWADIDAALVKLEAIAAERGVAIATASALPVTIERIARWSKTLEARGIRLVPVSVAFQRRTKQS
jgi:polysaccharide deacetylase 2 family uncharacterized protein YibQ